MIHGFIIDINILNPRKNICFKALKCHFLPYFYIKTYKSKQNFAHNLKLKKNLYKILKLTTLKISSL